MARKPGIWGPSPEEGPGLGTPHRQRAERRRQRQREGSPCSPQRSPAWPCFHTTTSYVGHRSERPDRRYESSLRWSRSV